MTHKEYADGLRGMAAFLEAHPEIELPSEHIASYGLYSKERAATTARALADGGRCDKVYEDTIVILKRNFGGVELRYYGTRSNVCEQVRVGTKRIPEQYVAPRPAIEGHTIPEHEEAVYEWVCAPLLGKPALESVNETPELPVVGAPMLEAENVDMPF